MGGVDPEPGLPVDSDEVARGQRGSHLRPGLIALVAAGGAVGTALREAVTLAVGPTGDFPFAIFAINVSGAFALGLLLEVLALRGGGGDAGRGRTVRLLLGTGVLGGYTTYSALAADSAGLLTGGGVTAALVYGAATVLVGALASWAGIALGSLVGRARPFHRDVRASAEGDAAGVDRQGDGGGGRA